MVVVADDGVIIRDCQDRLVIFLYKMSLSCTVVIFYTDISPEAHFLCILRTAKLKGVAVFEPVVRLFYLVAVFDFLLKHSIAVTDPASVSCISQSSKGI